MTDDQIIYEQPLNEIVRACLRLEYLFKQIDLSLSMSDIDPHTHSIIKLIIDILEILSRPDLKSKLTKEFSRYITIFSRLDHSTDINPVKLDITLEKLKTSRDYFLNTYGAFGQSVRNNNFINTIRQNIITAGGGSGVDTPHYFYWLNQPANIHYQQINEWLSAFTQVREAINLFLNIIRNSSEPRTLIANEGFHHEPLNSKAPCQLVRIFLPKTMRLYPETSVGRHYLSIHFIIPNMDTRPQQTNTDIKFNLNVCVI